MTTKVEKAEIGSFTGTMDMPLQIKSLKADCFKEIGQALARARKDKRLTVETVHNKTRISLRYLRAIEEGDLAQFPAEVYITGSLRRYAKYLDMNDESIIERFLGTCEPVVASEPLNVHYQHISLGRIFMGVSIGAVVLAAVSFTWLYLSMPRYVIQNAPVLTAAAKAGPNVSARDKVNAAIAAPIKLEVTWKEASWVRVTADDAMVFEGTLPAGAKKAWTAQSMFRLKIGYVPGVSVSFNDKDMDIAKGAQQDVNEVEFTRNGSL